MKNFNTENVWQSITDLPTDQGSHILDAHCHREYLQKKNQPSFLNSSQEINVVI